MPYSDEPDVVKAPAAGRKWLFWAVPLLLAFCSVILLAALAEPIHEWRKEHSEHGPNHGTVYRMRFEGAERAVEFGRSKSFHPAFFITPAVEKPEELTIEYTLPDSEPSERSEVRTARWDAEAGLWTAGQDSIHPEADLRMRVRILRGATELWSGVRWNYGEAHHHHH